MDIIQNTNDLVHVSIAFTILLLGIFLAWLIYYFAMIARMFYIIIKEMRDRVKKVDEVVTAFKEKIDHGTSYLLLISEAVMKLVDVAKESGFMKKESVPERVAKAIKKKIKK